VQAAEPAVFLYVPATQAVHSSSAPVYPALHGDTHVPGIRLYRDSFETLKLVTNFVNIVESVVALLVDKESLTKNSSANVLQIEVEGAP